MRMKQMIIYGVALLFKQEWQKNISNTDFVGRPQNICQSTAKCLTPKRVRLLSLGGWGGGGVKRCLPIFRWGEGAAQAFKS